MHIKCFSNWAAAPLPLIVLRLWLPLRSQTLFCHFFFKEYTTGESFFKLWPWLWWNKNPLTSFCLIFLTTFGETDFTAFNSQVWLGKSILNMILLIIFQCMIFFLLCFAKKKQ